MLNHECAKTCPFFYNLAAGENPAVRDMAESVYCGDDEPVCVLRIVMNGGETRNKSLEYSTL